MSPDSSFKSYRQALISASPPSLPYLGVSLTDLTFIEEGNPDNIDDKINFRKREQVYTSIRSLVQCQTSAYDFSIVEPIHTFLLELPYNNNETELYELSHFIERKEKS